MMKRPEDIAAITAIKDEFVIAVNAGDPAAVAALFTDDGIDMVPNEPAVVGRPTIQSRLQANFDKLSYQLTVSEEETEVAGDWAFSRDTGTLILTPKAGGDAVEVNAKCIVIYRRQPDGSWRIYRYIYNSDDPVPGTGE